MDNIIEARGLTRWYGKLQAVDHLDLTVHRGEIFGLLGPNGAGKTTTIRMLVGLSQPSDGTAVVNGYDVRRDTVQAKRSLGVVPELSNLYPELTCLDNLVYAAELYQVPACERVSRAHRLLEEFGLTDKRDARFQTLSRGLKRRLTIAAALVHRPPLVFLDEPTTGLDVVSAHNLRSLIRRLNDDGTTLVLTTHLIAEAEMLCDRLALIVNGKIIAVDSPEGLRNRLPQAPVLDVTVEDRAGELRRLLTEEESLRQVTATEGGLRLYVTSVHAALTAVVETAGRCGVTLTAVNTVMPTLEDAFVELTGVAPQLMRIDKPHKGGGS